MTDASTSESPELFVVSDTWRRTCPGALAGVLVMRDVVNPAEHAPLDARKAALEEELRSRFAGQTRAELRQLPVLQAYEAYYRRFQKTYHVQLQLESVALKGKPIPRVAALVEAMFMAELHNVLLTAGHDLATLDLPVRLDVAEGGESYQTLSGQEQALKAGDMYMADRRGIISSVLSGPDRRTRIIPETTSALFAVYAPAGIAREAVAVHLDELAANVRLIVPDARVDLATVEPG